MNHTRINAYSHPTALSRRQILTARFAKHSSNTIIYTPNDEFFLPPGHTIPPINADYWSVTLAGTVRNPLAVTYNELHNYPIRTIDCTVACARDRWQIGHARWTGVPLSILLNDVEITEQPAYARLSGADRYVTQIPYTHLQSALLAHTMNGEPLPLKQGFPARLIVPGLYDQQMPRWIERIELLGSADKTLLKRDRFTPVQVMSTLTAPQHLAPITAEARLQGYAFAGQTAVDRVDLRIDGGDWLPVKVADVPPFTWAHWSTPWTPPAPGDFQVQVRAVTVDGRVQSSTPAHCSSDIHSIIVRTA